MNKDWENVAKGAALYCHMAIKRRDWPALKNAEKILSTAQDHSTPEGALMRSINGGEIPAVPAGIMSDLMRVGEKSTKEEVDAAYDAIAANKNRSKPVGEKILVITKSPSGWPLYGDNIAGDPEGLPEGDWLFRTAKVEVIRRSAAGLVVRFIEEIK